MKKLICSPMTLSYVLSFFLCLTFAALSAPIRNLPQKLVQPDGAVVHCFASGDEFNHWLHDKDNYTIVQHPETGYFVYALLENGVLVPSSNVVGKINPASVGLTKGVRIPILDMKKRREAMLSKADLTSLEKPAASTLNNITIFIRFADEESKIFPDSIAKYDRMFNANFSGINSMFNFFDEVSYGKAAISTTFYPLAMDSLLSYQDTHQRDYYRKFNSVTNPIGYQNATESWKREQALLIGAIDAVAPQIPPQLNIDANGDGIVDNVCFIISGNVDAWADLLWPHARSLPLNSVLINEKQVRRFNFQLRDFLFGEAYVAVLVHEMFHTLGSPDLYHYSFDSLSAAGRWDVMDDAHNPPQHMGAYMKWKYGKWIDSIPTISAPGTYTLSPLTSATNNCYKILSPFSLNEFFVVEYRRRRGTFESSLPGEGLLVYRINSNYVGNSEGPPDEVYIYRHEGYPTLNGSPDSAAFSSNAGRTVLNDLTNPSCFLTDGSLGGLNITNVGALQSTISFTLGMPSVKIVPWMSQTSGTTDTLYGAAFSDAQTGTAVGNGGTILRTTDGGSVWNIQSSGTSNALYGVSFTDKNTGTVVGASGTIGRTTDGGASWTIQSSGTTSHLNGVSFINSSAGTAIGQYGTILCTTDGGQSWTKRASDSSITFFGVSMVNKNYCTVVGSNGFIRRTTDGGTTWMNQSSQTVGPLYGVSFPDTNNGIAVGWGGTIRRTSNGGLKWVIQHSGTTNYLYGISFTKMNKATVVGTSGTIRSTTNGGLTWIGQSSGVSIPLWGIASIDGMTITAVGNVGTILRTTTTGGLSDVKEPRLTEVKPPSEYSLSQNYPNPFNPSTTIRYSLPSSANVKLAVYDLLGREVAVLVNEEQSAGWKEVEWNASTFSSGIYFYKLTTEKFVETKKLMFLK